MEIQTWGISYILAILFWFSVGSIFYTYFAYPILIALFAKLRSRPTIPIKNLPTVSILIAAYNEEAVIEKKIKNCLSLDYPKNQLQILFVTDGSTDRTPNITQEYANQGIELLHQPERRGKMAAIIRAMSHVRGEIVVFSDANNFYEVDTLKKLISPFGSSDVGAASGAKLIDQGDGNLGASEGLYWKYESFIKLQESMVGSCTSAPGEILAIRKIVYIVPPENIINDDFFIAMQVIRQGYRMVYVPDAISIERVSLSAKDEITRRTRINAGRYQALFTAHKLLPAKPLIIWQVISHKFLRPLVPFAAIIALIANLTALIYPLQTNFYKPNLFFLSSPFGEIIFGLQALFYVMAWLGTQFKDPKSPSKLIRLLYLPTFLYNSNLAALMGFFQYLRGQQSHIWERIPRR